MTSGPALCPRPSADGTDGPFATLARALKAARDFRQQGATSKRRLTVWVRGGSYFLNQPLVFKPDDSELVLAAYPGETPVLSGGRPVTGWRETTVDGKKLWAADVPAARGGKWPFHELWVNGRRAVRARHPDKGYLAVAELPDKAADWTKGNSRFRFREGDLKAWNTVTNAEVVVMTKWVESRLPVLGVDEKERLVRFAKRSVFALEPGDLYYAEGALDFLDQPGEWCLDSAAGTLYYWPRPGKPSTRSRPSPLCSRRSFALKAGPRPGSRSSTSPCAGLTFSHTEWCFPQGFSAGEHAPVIDPAPAPDVGGFGQADIGVPGAVWGRGLAPLRLRGVRVLEPGRLRPRTGPRLQRKPRPALRVRRPGRRRHQDWRNCHPPRPRRAVPRQRDQLLPHSRWRPDVPQRHWHLDWPIARTTS